MYDRGGSMIATMGHRDPGRLTRRGRVVLAAGLILLAVAAVLPIFVRSGEGAEASRGAPPTVVVQSGDTLWSIAQRHGGGRHVFETIEQIRLRNQLPDYRIVVGQQLVLPGRG